jgi:ABC-type transport system involved in cytochrome c biogenesis ATPase subunit
LVPVSRGHAVVAGCDLRHDRAAVRSKVGLLGHANGLYGDLTVSENVEFWGATVGATADEVGASLERLGLAGRLADVAVQRLSAGQRRRTALACLVARRAQLWLLDEPHAGLDAQGRDDLDATLRAAVAMGATVMVASHELERAGSLATRIVDVVAGQVRPVDGRPADATDSGEPAWACGERPVWWPPRTCASSGAAGSSPTRCCRSPGW